MKSLDQHDFMSTYTGKRVQPSSLLVEDISLVDIAHALSNLCRFTGHATRFYSVAQHSILVAAHLPTAHALEGLLHDAAEAYINDLSRPLKHHPTMTAYLALEEHVDTVVRQKFGLPLKMSPLVKYVDNQLVVDEAIALMAEHSWSDGHGRLGVDIQPMSPTEAEIEFVRAFTEYGGKL